MDSKAAPLLLLLLLLRQRRGFLGLLGSWGVAEPILRKQLCASLLVSFCCYIPFLELSVQLLQSCLQIGVELDHRIDGGHGRDRCCRQQDQAVLARWG